MVERLIRTEEMASSILVAGSVLDILMIVVLAGLFVAILMAQAAEGRREERYYKAMEMWAKWVVEEAENRYHTLNTPPKSQR